MNLERATFAAGCFWGVEASFRELEGVVKTSVGYTGGTTPYPSYEDVCSGATGHAEAVDVWFDPAHVGYSELLEAFWLMHDPTTPNRQGWDLAASTARRSSSTIRSRSASLPPLVISTRRRSPGRSSPRSSRPRRSMTPRSTTSVTSRNTAARSAPPRSGSRETKRHESLGLDLDIPAAAPVAG